MTVVGESQLSTASGTSGVSHHVSVRVPRERTGFGPFVVVKVLNIESPNKQKVYSDGAFRGIKC